MEPDIFIAKTMLWLIGAPIVTFSVALVLFFAGELAFRSSNGYTSGPCLPTPSGLVLYPAGIAGAVVPLLPYLVLLHLIPRPRSSRLRRYRAVCGCILYSWVYWGALLLTHV